MLGPLLSPLLTKLIDGERLREAQRGLDQAIDALEEIRMDAEARAAVRGDAWQDGPEGRRCRSALDEIVDQVSVLRRWTLPDLEMLR